MAPISAFLIPHFAKPRTDPPRSTRIFNKSHFLAAAGHILLTCQGIWVERGMPAADRATFCEPLTSGAIARVPSRSGNTFALDASAAHWEAGIVAAQQGDREALGELFRRLGAYLRARAQEQLNDRLQGKVSPSDVVQETLLEAHRGFATFHGGSRAELVMWMQGILNHRVQTAYRRYRGTSKRNIAREARFALSNESSRQQLSQLAALSGSPSAHAVKNEESARLEEALRRLSARHEQVIRLRNELKLSFAEVAVAIGCSPNAAQKLWTRAVDQLARIMNPDVSD